MTDNDEKRHKTYEQIRANEIARGASEDEASQIAAATVDKVLAAQDGSD
ncbi:hypothetical protein [Demequina sp.]